MRQEEFREIERGCHPYTQRILELLGNAPPDTLCATRNDGYFILEIHHLSYIRIIFATLLASLFQPCIRLAHQEMATVVGNLDLCTLLEQHDDV